MVCLIGTGRMMVMARLLAAGQNIAEEVGQQKLAAQYICRELREADEANLLDEEDMHVFGLMPMTEPLDLVCCNACKKPVKASQYAAHAELCRFLSSGEEMTLEAGGGIGRRKPPRKERKKILTTYSNQATPVGEHERTESVVVDDTVPSESQLDGQHRMPSSFSATKKSSASVDAASTMHGKGVSPENTDFSACVMPPPMKRRKFMSSQLQPLLDDPETASDLTKVTSTIDPSTYIPVSLATKIYYSQSNARLRSVVAHLYHATTADEPQNAMVYPEPSQESMMQSWASTWRGSLDAQVDDLINEKRYPSVHQPDQILPQSSEMCLDKSGGCPPVTNFSNQGPVDNVLWTQATPIGLLRSKYLSKPYSFAGNPGQSLGTMQQPNGSVSVL